MCLQLLPLGAWAAYGEVEAGIQPMRKLRLTAHVGSLVPLDSTYASRVQYDWQISATREVGPLSLRATFSDGGPAATFTRTVGIGAARL